MMWHCYIRKKIRLFIVSFHFLGRILLNVKLLLFSLIQEIMQTLSQSKVYLQMHLEIMKPSWHMTQKLITVNTFTRLYNSNSDNTKSKIIHKYKSVKRTVRTFYVVLKKFLDKYLIVIHDLKWNCQHHWFLQSGTVRPDPNHPPGKSGPNHGQKITNNHNTINNKNRQLRLPNIIQMVTFVHFARTSNSYYETESLF